MKTVASIESHSSSRQVHPVSRVCIPKELPPQLLPPSLPDNMVDVFQRSVPPQDLLRQRGPSRSRSHHGRWRLCCASIMKR